MSLCAASILLMPLLAPSAALAHDFWFEHQGNELVLQYGHRGGESLPIASQKIKSLRCLSKDASIREVLPAAVFASHAVRFTAKCEVISAFYDGGFWSLTPDGEKNLPKNQVPDAVKAWESKQFSKWINPRSPSASKPIGDELEIVPVTDLSRVKTGDKATFRVLYLGKPIAGAVAAINHQPLGETDSAGEVRLRIRSTTTESISATLRRPISTPQADTQVLEASLSFEVAK